MNYALQVCLIAWSLIASFTPTIAAQTLQKGVSVELAASTHSTPMPDADNENSWILTVTAAGKVYFGIDAVTPDRLAEEMKSRPRNREQKLYIKADAKTPYTNVESVLNVGHAAAFDAPVLLTSQQETAQAGTLVPPRGLEVSVSGSLPSGAPLGSKPTVVRVLASKQSWPTLKVDDAQIPWSELQTMLTQLLQRRSDRTILVKADGQLPYAQVVHVIDKCRAAGGQIVVLVPEL